MVTFTWSCNNSDDVVTADAQEGGGLVDTSKSIGKFLGATKEGTDSMTLISDAELNFVVRFKNGGNTGSIRSLSVVKSFNGSEEVEVTSFSPSETPFTVNVGSENDFYDGLGLSRENMLVGDKFVFRTKINMADGRVLYASPGDGEYTVNVACVSQLAGVYTSNITRSDGGTATFTQIITETKPGEYITSRAGTWAPGVLATPTGEAPTIFTDVCSSIFIPQQDLGQFYGNQVYGFEGPEAKAGSVDLLTGVITFSYIIEFSSGNTTYTEVLTPN